MRKKIICIGCPLGCILTVDHNQKKVQEISGNRCKQGLKYAEKELFNPERTITTTVKVNNGHLPLVSVRTSKPIPKNYVFDAMNLLAKVEVKAPIKIGDIIIQSLFDTNVSIVATKNILKKGNNWQSNWQSSILEKLIRVARANASKQKLTAFASLVIRKVQQSIELLNKHHLIRKAISKSKLK